MSYFKTVILGTCSAYATGPTYKFLLKVEQGPSEEVGRNVKITTIPGVTTYSVAAKQGDMNSGYEDFDYHWAGLPSRETYPGIPLGTRMMVSGTRMATGSKTETFLADAITQLK